MCKQNIYQLHCALVVLVVSILLTACGSTPRLTPTPTIDREVIQGELVATLLDRIVKTIQVRGLEDTYLIVWSPVQSSRESPTIDMDITEPIKVWWYEGDQLTEASDPAGAIEQFRQEQMAVEPYRLYKFGILSVADDGKLADVYIGYDCGGLDCHGRGHYFYLERNDQGTWEVSRDRTSILIME